MNQAATYHGPLLPWDDSARHNKILRALTPLLVIFFFAIVAITQWIEVPKIEHTHHLSSPDRLARWLQDPAEPSKPKSVVAPKPVPPKVTAPKPTAPAHQPPKVKKAPEPTPTTKQAAKPSARARAQQHANAFNAFSTLTQVNQDQALQADHSNLKDGTSADSTGPSVHLTPRIAKLSDQTASKKTTAASNSATLAASSRTQVSSAPLVRSAQLASAPQTKSPSNLTPQHNDERSRTDIQRAFDANKTSLYSIYRRALRSNPAIQGTLVLALHIAPSGKVIKIDIANSDLGNTKLEKKLMRRIKMINFGEKAVKPWSGQYPIEFLPTAV